MIAGKRFAGYILTVADLAAGRRTCGRGSAASSLVCYLLALTNVDPITSNLLFERFLSPERTDPPDIDIDFPWDERDAVLAAAIATHGTARVAMVATHQYLRRWSAIREVARAYGVASAEITRARTALDHAERFGLPSGLGEPWPAVLAAAEAVTGSPHHLGLHCGGIVITAEPVRDLVPVHPAAKQLSFQVMRAAAAGATRVHEAWEDPTVADGALDLPTIAWEKDGAEDLGLVKIDLLGNRGLAVVRDCVAQINAEREAAGRRAGEAAGAPVVDEATWRPQDDPATQGLVARGATMGCFYIESPATRQLQAKVGDGSFDRLVVHSSIIRPAAMRWIDTYIERYQDFKAHGVLRPEWFPHPALAKLLSDSFGVLSYQEDVMLIAQHIAGFDSGGANQLRKALGHFDTGHRLEPLRERFASGARARGDVPEPVITVLWDMIMSFSGYSFCKAHSASYAMVSFQSAWLKAHHPAHFLACVVANEGGFYRASAYLEEARRLGIAIRGPCVLASAHGTRAEGAGAIRCGFHLVPGVAKRVAERIVAARRAAPFRSLRDLRARARVGAAVLDVLARAGALDALLPGCNPAQRRWLAASVGLAAPARSGAPQQTTWWAEADPLADPHAARPARRARPGRGGHAPPHPRLPAQRAPHHAVAAATEARALPRGGRRLEEALRHRLRHADHQQGGDRAHQGRARARRHRRRHGLRDLRGRDRPARDGVVPRRLPRLRRAAGQRPPPEAERRGRGGARGGDADGAAGGGGGGGAGVSGRARRSSPADIRCP